MIGIEAKVQQALAEGDPDRAMRILAGELPEDRTAGHKRPPGPLTGVPTVAEYADEADEERVVILQSELTAEVELLAAAVSFVRSVGLTPADVGIKISTRSVLSELLTSLGVPDEKFAATCVLVDKLGARCRMRCPSP